MRIVRRRDLRGTSMVKLTLIISGLVAVGIAGTILLAPEVFYASYGIEVGSDVTLVNELKAPAGALLVAGILMFAGVFRTKLVKFSLTTASAVYLSYGLSRLLSMAVDGLPASGLVSAASIELGIGTASLLALLRAREINLQYVTRRTQ